MICEPEINDDVCHNMQTVVSGVLLKHRRQAHNTQNPQAAIRLQHLWDMNSQYVGQQMQHVKPHTSHFTLHTCNLAAEQCHLSQPAGGRIAQTVVVLRAIRQIHVSQLTLIQNVATKQQARHQH